MITNYWSLNSTGPTDWKEAVVEIERIEGDERVLYQPRFVILKPTKNCVVKFVSNPDAATIARDVTNSTGLSLAGGNEYTFDPLEEPLYKVLAAGTDLTITISCGRYIPIYRKQITKLPH